MLQTIKLIKKLDSIVLQTQVRNLRIRTNVSTSVVLTTT